MLHSAWMKLNQAKVWWLGILVLLVVVLTLSPTNRVAEATAPAVSQSQPVEVLLADAERVRFAVNPTEMKRTPVMLGGNSYERLSIEGYAVSAVAGQPQLPEKSFVVALPPGAVPVVSVVEQIQEQVSGVKVAPVTRQELVRFEGVLAAEAPEFVERVEFNADVYGQDKLFPSAAATLSNVFWLRDQRVVSVLVHPVQVNPVTENVFVSTRLVIEVRFTYPEGRPEGHAPRPESPVYEDILQASLLNYEQANNWREVRQLAAAPQTSPCLSDWNPNTFRIATENKGIHQITYAELVTAGLSGTVSSNRIQMCHFDQEIAIWVDDGGDGTFGSGDEVIFYGESIKTQETETNVYWLTIDPDETGLRMTTASAAPNAAATPNSYTLTQHLEQDNSYYNAYPTQDLNDHWYWALMAYSTAPTVNAQFSVNNLETAGYTLTVRGELWGYKDVEPHRYRVLLNGTQVGPDQYFYGSGADNVSHIFNLQIASSALVSGNNTLTVESLADGTANPNHIMLLNWLEIDYQRRFVDESDRLLFTQTTSGTWKYSVSSFATTPDVFEVTNAETPIRLTGATGTSTLLFERQNNSPATFALSTAAARYAVLSITKDTFPSAHLQTTTNQADYIIITDPSLSSGLTPLISRRTTVDGLTVRTVYVQDIFDEFSYGLYDPEGIRRFLEFTYGQWASPAPTYVLLVGEGSYDHRNLLGNNGTTGNLVPVYLRSGVDSWLGETAADNQYVEFAGNALADMLLGRLPVKTTTELGVVINKIIAYETAATDPSWHSQHLFVSDNGLEYNTSTQQCGWDPAGDFFATLNTFLEDHFPGGRQFANLIYYAPTQCYPAPQPGDYAPTALDVQTRFHDLLDRGQNFVVYMGHSGVDFWGGGPQLITTAHLNALTNGNKTPIMLPMTCLEGFYHTPEREGFSELMLRKSGGGAVASYAPTGLQVQTGHDYLLTGFYEGAFDLDYGVIGQVVLNAKLVLLNSGNNSVQDLHDTYMLQGDPAMHMRTWEANYNVSLPLAIR